MSRSFLEISQRIFYSLPHQWISVSVIIPTYNRVVMLQEAITSVLEQTYTDFELIVVDDGSTDETQEVLRQYADRLIYLRHDENQGVSAARNRGIRSARGEWIAFLDSDDLWRPEKLEIQIAFFDKTPDAHICQTEEIWVRRGKRVNPKKIHRKYSGDVFRHCLPLCIVSPSAVMIRRKLLDEVRLFDESLPACEDYDLWLRISKKYPIYLINQPLIVKRGGHSDQLSGKYWGMDRFRVQSIANLLKNNDLSDEQYQLAVSELHRKCGILIQGFRKRKKFEDAEKYQIIKEKYG
ncbi:MAG: glycosyl transferase [Candidatus Cloacimonetes bacterium 4572_55]|nr:MAG: glycosyl transferase [Candidatus Cloacimonetes bacterium 4572_55]